MPASACARDPRLIGPLTAAAQATPGLVQIINLCRGDAGADNALIHGDNLVTMRALAPTIGGSVRCIYLDPPYNNNERYTHYDDRWLHRDWLQQLAERLAVARDLLSEDGSLWISIDDREVHYVRMLLEDTFGRDHFVSTIVWHHRKSRENRKVFSNNHEYVLCVAKDRHLFSRSRNLLPANESILARYRNPDADPRGPWQSVSANVQAGHATPAQFYTLMAPSGAAFTPPKGRCWAYSKPRVELEIARGNIWFGKNGTAAPRIKKFLADARPGMTPTTLWPADEVGTTEQAKKEALRLLPNSEVFDTPKPEALVARIIAIATDPGDLVLDPYLGSGTTAAVAMKMGRRFLGVERGEHVVSHSLARLEQVVAGELGGVSAAYDWSGGGGFGFYALT